MRSIFIFTAGDKDARSHLSDSILNSVPFAWMRDFLRPAEAEYYQSLVPNEEGFYAWGAVPGPVNQRTWEAMQVGDLVLTVYDNQYHFLASVTGKFNSRNLASRIWGLDEQGRTWEYMYLLSPPQRVAVPVMSEPVADYLNKGYRGYTRISDDKVSAILKEYGSLDQFVQAVFHSEIPETHIQRALEEATEKAEENASVIFDPTDMIDGRRRVVQEIVRRQGQPKFRKELLAAYAGQCAVTGCDVEAVLEAAHISPYLGHESNAIQNGLLLRADIHTLFDLGQLKITPAGQIQLHENLFGTTYETYQKQFIRLPKNKALAPTAEALTLKFNLIL